MTVQSINRAHLSPCVRRKVCDGPVCTQHARAFLSEMVSGSLNGRSTGNSDFHHYKDNAESCKPKDKDKSYFCWPGKEGPTSKNPTGAPQPTLYVLISLTVSTPFPNLHFLFSLLLGENTDRLQGLLLKMKQIKDAQLGY